MSETEYNVIEWKRRQLRNEILKSVFSIIVGLVFWAIFAAGQSYLEYPLLFVIGMLTALTIETYIYDYRKKEEKQ